MPHHHSPDELTLTVARIKGLLLTREKADRAVQQLAEAIRDALPRSLGAGVILVDGQGRGTSTGATAAAVLEADTAQFQVNQGPCLSAWSTRKTVLVHDAAADHRWPLWARAAAELSIGSVVSSPLMAGSRCLGNLAVYSRQPGAFDAGTGRMLEKFAVPAATLLDSIQGSDAPHRLTEALAGALQSRDAANRARGALMQRYGFGPDRALRELMRLARTTGQPLASVSTGILAGTATADGT